jgi:hypothetical protein
MTPTNDFDATGDDVERIMKQALTNDEVRAALALIPVSRSSEFEGHRLPDVYDKVRMKEFGQRVIGIEETAEGICARLLLLEHRLEKQQMEIWEIKSVNKILMALIEKQKSK